MKLLQVAIVSAILVEYVTASSDTRSMVYAAIGEGDWELAAILCRQVESLCEEVVSHVIEKGDPELIANFINESGQKTDGTLEKLYQIKSKEVIGSVLEKVKFPYSVAYSGICVAVDKGRLDIAVELSKQNELVGGRGVDCATEKGDPEFIASFINQTNQANARSLGRLSKIKSTEAFKSILKKVDFSQADLIAEAPGYAQECKNEEFLELLSKIKRPKIQEAVIEGGIKWQFEFHGDECIASLLDGLKGKTFRSERLEVIAMQTAFKEVGWPISPLLEKLSRHPAITPDVYADALIKSEKWVQMEKHALHQWLLTRADRFDLEKVVQKEGYEKLKPWFRASIEKALETAAPGGTRTRVYDVQTAEKAEETFEELEHPGMSEDPTDIVSAFVALDAPTPRRQQQIAAKKVAKEATSEVTSTPTKAEGSEDTGSENVGTTEE